MKTAAAILVVVALLTVLLAASADAFIAAFQGSGVVGTHYLLFDAGGKTTLNGGGSLTCNAC